METQTFSTKPLMRPAQVKAAKQDIAALEAQVNNPLIEDRGEARKKLIRIRKSFEEQMPRAPATGEEEGRMVARSKQLLDEILVGMPSQEEMRKAPPGAVDKHMAWEKRNKPKILEWKNLQLRLTDGREAEAANLEKYRPTGSTLNMDNAYIPGKMFFMPPANAGLAVTFSDEQLQVLRALNPQLADMLGLMSNARRQEVKEAIGGIGLEEEDPRKTPEARARASEHGRRGVAKREAARSKKVRRARKPLSEEQKQALRDRLAKAREAQATKRQAGQEQPA